MSKTYTSSAMKQSSDSVSHEASLLPSSHNSPSSLSYSPTLYKSWGQDIEIWPSTHQTLT